MGNASALHPPLMWTTVATVAVGVAAAIWGLIPFEPFDPRADYYMPFQVDPASRKWTAVAGLAVTLVLLARAVWMLSTGKADRRWGRRVLLPMIVFGVLIGYAARWGSTGIIGADFGIGPLIMFCALVSTGFLFYALVCGMQLLELAEAAKTRAESAGGDVGDDG